MEKQQQLRERKTEKAKKAKSAVERKTGTLNLPDLSSREFLGELSKMKAITPYGLASKYGLRLSVAKDLLEELVKQGTLQAVAGCSRLRVYKLAAA